MNSKLKCFSEWLQLLIAFFVVASVASIVVLGIPTEHFRLFFTHQIIDIEDDVNFRIKTIRTAKGRELNPFDQFSYKFDLPIRARGTTTYSNHDALGSNNSNDIGGKWIWAFLSDRLNINESGSSYYLQNPPITIEKGEWRSYNVNPLHDIKRVIWYATNKDGHDHLSKRIKEHDDPWRAMIRDNNKCDKGNLNVLPCTMNKLASIQLEARTVDCFVLVWLFIMGFVFVVVVIILKNPSGWKIKLLRKFRL